MGAEGKRSGQNHDEQPPITIRVRSLDNGRFPVEITRDAAVLEYPAFSGEVHVTGSLEKEGERLHLDVIADSLGHFECTRCADPFDRTIKAHVQVEFVPPSLVSDPEDENVHLYDPLAKPYIDITADVRDALALAIPMKHLCHPDCKGLCPICGQDLNVEECDCQREESAGGNWSALNGLRERLRAEESKGMGHQGSVSGSISGSRNPAA